MKIFPNLHNLKQIWFSIDRRAQFYNIMKPHANNAYIMHYYTIKQHVNPKIQFKKSITAIRFGSTISYLIPIGRKECIYPFFPNQSRKRLIELIHGQIFDESFIPLLPANNTSLGNRAIARRTVSINQDQRGHHPPSRVSNNETTTFHSPSTPSRLRAPRSRFSFPLISCNCKRMNEVPGPIVPRTNEQYLLRGCSLLHVSATEPESPSHFRSPPSTSFRGLRVRRNLATINIENKYLRLKR